MANEERSDYSQTQFTFEEPILQQVDPATPSAHDEAAPKKKPSRLVVAGVLAAGALILVIGLLAIFAPSPQTVGRLPAPSPSAQPDPVVDPLRAKLTDLQDELKDADPAKTPLTYPTVEMQIELEPKKL